jgi:hypothetical protein
MNKSVILAMIIVTVPVLMIISTIGSNTALAHFKSDHHRHHHHHGHHMAAGAIVAFVADRLRDHLFFFSYNVEQFGRADDSLCIG